MIVGTASRTPSRSSRSARSRAVASTYPMIGIAVRANRVGSAPSITGRPMSSRYGPVCGVGLALTTMTGTSHCEVMCRCALDWAIMPGAYAQNAAPVAAAARCSLR